MMDKAEVLSESDVLIEEGNSSVLASKYTVNVPFYTEYVNQSLYKSWLSKVIAFCTMFLPKKNEFLQTLMALRPKDSEFTYAEICMKTLENVRTYVEKDYITLQPITESDGVDVLTTLFQRFFKVARQLQNRHDSRATIAIEDEYDVQDLLHALLKIYFDDIRPEEWTPSYAGKSARVDFLLKQEKIVIEVKKTRQGLTDKELGDQLIVDVERYKAHPACEKLICFVYDPEGRIGNPTGIMDDLNKRHEGFATVVIEPNA